ncbi:chloride channel protein [Frateuria sp. Soil773]|uniref:chloride channel protein n=1 Tax=Frateuria sp. Soil773 TaxID=1736407 RepID=UPI000701C708|nr:chloride channel protein [Frateuria sp. Soil773]KRE94967.1 chloride channel protein [Frateuria sp. Soil773]
MSGQPPHADDADHAPPPGRLPRLGGSDLFSAVQWRRRILFWAGAVLVGLAAVGFATAADYVFGLFHRVVQHNRLWPLLITPPTFALLAWLTQGVLKPTRGSGIPQAIAALKVEDEPFRKSLLSLRVALGKMGLTLAALLGGASVGREGPTVHVGAGLLYSLGRRFGFADPTAAGRFILAGSAAGLAAAFNTPLAGVVFAIEEMSGAFEHRMSGILLTAVIIAGVVSLGILGNYAYFGRLDIGLPLGKAWLAVLATGLVCGLAGGLFARLILPHDRGLRGVVGRLRARQPVLFAAACGLALVLLSLLTRTGLYGTGYAQARAILEGHSDTVEAFGALKFLGNIASYWAGIPGGIFSPALAVGAGLGANISHLLAGVDPAAVVLLGMAAYLSGVTQAPLTATVISMELTANQQMALPIMATCLLARAASSLLCRKPVYRALADRLIEGYEHEVARREAQARHEDAAAQPGPAMVEDPATPNVPDPAEPPSIDENPTA